MARWQRTAELMVFFVPVSWLLGITPLVPLIALLLCTGIALAHGVIHHRQRVPLTRFDVVMIAFVGYALASLLWSAPAPITTLNIRNPALVATAMLSVLAISGFLKNAQPSGISAHRICRWIAISGPAVVFLVLLDYLLPGGGVFPTERSHGFNARLVFSFSANQSPNTASYFFGIGILTSLQFVRFSTPSTRHGGIGWVGLMCHAMLFSFCGSIASALGLIIALLVGLAVHRDRIALCGIVVVLLTSAVGLHVIQLLCECAIANQDRARSASYRGEIWAEMIDLWRSRPLLGQGFFTPIEVTPAGVGKAFTAHSLLLNQLVSGGIIGGIFTATLAGLASVNALILAFKKGQSFPLLWLIFVTPILATHKYMAFLLEPYVWLIAWGPLILPCIVRRGLIHQPETE